MKRKTIIAFACAFIIGLAGPCSSARAGSPATSGNSNDGFQNATTWSTELAGDLWGWRLTKYKSFDDAYTIGDQTLLLLSTDGLHPTDNVLWNPLTGMGRHLDRQQYVNFGAKHVNDRPAWWTSPILLRGGQTLQSVPSPAQYFPCQAVLFRYYELSAQDRRILAAVYVLRKLGNPRLIKYYTCPEAALATKHYMKIDFLLDLTYVAELPDSTLLFASFESRHGLIIIRLDQHLRQHTTLGGRVFVADAAPINSGLHPEGNGFDMYNQFVSIFMNVFSKDKASIGATVGP